MQIEISESTQLRWHNTAGHFSIPNVEAARLFGVTQPRVSDLMRGKIELFGLDALVYMAVNAGMQLELREPLWCPHVVHLKDCRKIE